VDLTYQSDFGTQVSVSPTSALLSTAQPCVFVTVQGNNLTGEPITVTLVATLNGVQYLSEPMTFESY
jgi:hypothetical protein